MRHSPNLLKRMTSGFSSRFGQYCISGAALVCGVTVGALMANVTGFGSQLFADSGSPEQNYLAKPLDPFAQELRSVARLPLELGQQALGPVLTRERLEASSGPRIVIIFDDVGFDGAAFDRIRALPGPLTLSFLPYAPNVNQMVEKAKRDGHEILLHLPMEPVRKANNPGPNALTTADSDAQLKQKLQTNLQLFNGYVGVNNHMGSRLTANKRAMKLVLEEINRRNLYFVDSVTTGRTVASKVAEEIGANAWNRDVFLDADHGDTGAPNVKARLDELEQKALANGYAIAIAHPYTSTIETLEVWLLSVELRGFNLTTITKLQAEFESGTQALAAFR